MLILIGSFPEDEWQQFHLVIRQVQQESQKGLFTIIEAHTLCQRVVSQLGI